MFKKLAFAAIIALLAAFNAHAATTLSGDLTADDSFTAYLSTDDSVLGGLIASGASWPTTFSFAGAALAPGVTNYLHVIAIDGGAPHMFVGDFTLSAADYQFVNGSQTLETNTTDWKSLRGTGIAWTTPTGTPIPLGFNSGGAVWSGRASIPGTAEFIWAAGATDPAGEVAFFSTPITFTAAIPEPSTYALMLAGLGFVGFVANRRRKSGNAAA